MRAGHGVSDPGVSGSEGRGGGRERGAAPPHPPPHTTGHGLANVSRTHTRQNTLCYVMGGLQGRGLGRRRHTEYP